MTEKPKHPRRVVKRFVWWPTCLDGEWRWWSRQWIVQERIERIGIYPECSGFKHDAWVNRHWLYRTEETP